MRATGWLGAISLCGMVATNAWALDPSQYAQAKAAGVAVLSKDANGRIWQVFQTFNQTTGQNAGERRDEVLVTNLNAQRTEFVKRIEEIDALLAEIKVLQATP